MEICGIEQIFTEFFATQSSGKARVPAEVARRASLHGVPVVALAGTLGRGCRDVHDIGIDAIASIMPIPMTLQEAVDDGERLLIEAAERFMRTIILGA